MIPLEQLLQVYVPIFSTYSWLVNVLIGCLALFGISSRMFRMEPMTLGYKNPMSFLIAALYILWALSIIWTPAQSIALDSFRKMLPYILTYLILFPLLITGVHDFRRMLTGVMVLGSIIALFIIANPHSSYYSGRLRLDISMAGHGVADASNPLALAEMGSFIALVAALIRPPKPSFIFTAIRICAFFAGFGLAIGSGSRGQVLAAGITGILFFPVSRQLKSVGQFFAMMIGLGILTFALVLVFYIFVGSQNQQRWDVYRMLQDTTLRLDNVMELFALYLKSPHKWLFGLGTQAYAAIAPNAHVQYVHNVTAEIFLELGLVGGTIFIAMVVIMFRNSRRLFAIYKDDPCLRSVVAVLLAECVNSYFLSCKEGSLSFPEPFLWWIVAAKIMYYEQMVASSEMAYPADPSSELPAYWHKPGALQPPALLSPRAR
ncbi:MAG TPA: O-antigen ligase family protein [Phycisphaerales bacterium]|nr:O-antigen ligase family protein [Phycisphaerales bacterium]